MNKELDRVWHYHEATKHSSWSVRTSQHYLDWANYPLPFKVYSTLEPIPLPREWPPAGVNTFTALGAGENLATEEAIPQLRFLASILYHSAGITRRRSSPGGDIYFRAAACTGALYEIELYLVCGPLPDLEAGVYHFNPADFALRQLRSGDYRGVLVQATGEEPVIEHAPVVVVSTGIYWRNAWKYQARTYRHFFWDNGTILANLLAMSRAQRLPARLVLGFQDSEVNRLLSLDTNREVAVSLVSLGWTAETPPEPPTNRKPLPFETLPVSKKEIDYPLMRKAHEASSLLTPAEAKDWRGRTPRPPASPAGRLIPLQPISLSVLPAEPVEQVIERRGSTRRFARSPIRFDQLSTLLASTTEGISADFLDPPASRLNDLYLIANAVEGLASGAYVLRRDELALELLREGAFREQGGRLGLEQELPADASVDIFFLADLNRVLERYGNRGYRAAQMEAGILGGKLYLGAYALRLGATGLTFYDDEVIEFFSPHAEGKSTLFLVAVGLRAKRDLRVL